MTKRLLALTVVVVLAHPAPASAGLWAWLEQWSGPGPFSGITFLFTTCVQDERPKPSPIAMNDDYHVTELRRSKDVAAIINRQRQQENLPPLAPATVFKRLLANTEFSMLSALAANVTPAEPPPPPSINLFDSQPTREVTEALLETLRTALAERSDASLVAVNKALGNYLQQAAIGVTKGVRAEAENQTRNLNSFRLDDETLYRIYKQEEADRGAGHDDKRLFCGYVDYGYFDAPPNDVQGYNRINAHMVDIGPNLRLHDGLDVGSGIGFVKFTGDGVRKGPLLMLTPIRVVLKPALMIVPDHYRRKWMGLLAFYWKQSYMKGTLSATDFGASGSYSVTGEPIRSLGLNFDLGSLLTTNWNPKR